MIIKNCLLKIAHSQFNEETELPWFQKKLESLSSDFKKRNFYLTFSACPRFISKEAIQLDDNQRKEMESIYPNFSKRTWPKDEIARIILMTHLPVEENNHILDDLFATADMRESIALYKGLYFLENAEDFVLRCREGLRTNMVGIFDAIVHHNPYPAKYLSEDAWNQMVLKAMFMERPIYKIDQIEERKNQKLSEIFIDYAHERWSAHRKVSPELWCFIAGFVNDVIFEDIQKVILNPDGLEKIAATKALKESDYPKGHQWLVEKKINIETPSWENIGEQFQLDNIQS